MSQRALLQCEKLIASRSPMLGNIPYRTLATSPTQGTGQGKPSRTEDDMKTGYGYPKEKVGKVRREIEGTDAQKQMAKQGGDPIADASFRGEKNLKSDYGGKPDREAIRGQASKTKGEDQSLLEKMTQTLRGAKDSLLEKIGMRK